MISIKDFSGLFGLTEGVYDPGILKAVFLAGGPGAGKSRVSGEILGIPDKQYIRFAPSGLKLINSDPAFEHFLNKAGYGTNLDKMDDRTFNLVTAPTEVDPKSPRSKAKRLMGKQYELYTKGRLGLLIDGTADDIKKIWHQKKQLEQMGYDTYLIFVNTTLQKALDRNRNRARVLPDKIVKDSWSEVQKNMGMLQGLFSGDMVIVDNSKDFPEGKLQLPKFVFSTVKQFVKKPVKNAKGKKWIKRALDMKRSV